MASASKPVSSRSSRSAPSATRSPSSSAARDALPQAGQDAAGRAADQQDLAAPRGVAEDPAVDEVRPERAHAGEPGPDLVQLLQVHQVVDAGEDQPLAAAKPADLRVNERAWLGLVASDGSREPVDQPLALRDLAEKRRAILVRGAGDALDDGRGIVGPALGGRQRRRHAQPDPRLAIVADALRDVPVAFSARERQHPVGDSLDVGGERVGEARQLDADGLRGAGTAASTDLTTDFDESAGLDAAPRRDDVGCPRFERIDPGRGRRRRAAHSRSKRSTGRTKTVAPPTSTSSG